MPSKILEKIINEKYDELQIYKNQSGIFNKIQYFEGNAIGQIGEKFVKEVFRSLNLAFVEQNKTIHDEYDLISNNKKIEIKTARKGLKNNSFQFNSINPKYNCDYIVLLGITFESVLFYIIDKARDYRYEHKTRREYIKIHDKERQLVQMNPGNAVNLKLTLMLKDLKNIQLFGGELVALFRY